MTASKSSKDETAARVRAFLALWDDMPDGEWMWMTGGLTLSWGDLRLLADYDRHKVQLDKHLKFHCLECEAVVTSVSMDSMINLPCGHAAGTFVARPEESKDHDHR